LASRQVDFIPAAEIDGVLDSVLEQPAEALFAAKTANSNLATGAHAMQGDPVGVSGCSMRYFQWPKAVLIEPRQRIVRNIGHD